MKLFDFQPKMITTFGMALATLVAFDSVASAQSSQPSQSAFTGVWQYVEDTEEDERRQQAIEKATEDLSIFIRGTARGRLEEQTTPPREFKLAVNGETFRLTRDGKSVSLQFDAPPITVERDGKRGKLSIRSDGGRLVLLREGENGSRLTTYTLSSDAKQLTMSVRMRGARLSAPVAFKSTYKRQ